jgi:SAM-dependent methyltransferase
MEKTGYDLLAPEYYDGFHKTCRNFDVATEAALAQDPIEIPDQGMILEVGCGRGRSNEFLGLPANRIVQLDASREMLALEDREPSSLRVLADATSVPLFDKQFSGIVGFLIDPFIGLAFFSETYRLLVPGGRLVVTTPAAEWALSLRGHDEPGASSARFITKDRRSVVVVPSTVMSSTRIAEMLAFYGFESITITEHCLPEGADPISPDIQIVAEKQAIEVHEVPILYVISANRPN